MGVQKKQNNLIFVKTKDGKFFLKDDPEPYDELQGTITDIGFEDAEFEKGSGKKVEMLYVVVSDGDKFYKVTFNFDSIATTNFIKFLKSANIKEQLLIIPSMKEEDNVKKRSIFVKQDGKYLKAFYSKDNPNGLPQLRKTKFKGQEKWDNGEQLEFLRGVVENDLKNQIQGNVVVKKETVQAGDDNQPADDLPF